VSRGIYFIHHFFSKGIAFYKRFSCFTWFLLFFLSVSCENDLKTIEKLSAQDTLHLESAKDIELIYSDSGRLAIRLTSPAYVRYKGKGTFLEFPQGIRVVFYKELQESSTLTAKFALINEENNQMEARNNVEVINLDKGEKLNTERLIWDERKKRIYSNEFVKITTRDKVLFGKGFESDQNFDNWVIKKPSGNIAISPDQ
jgi:LPS export ABC transporter protein LptC